MTRQEAIKFLHANGYSRRMSAKLVDIAILSKSSRPFAVALKEPVVEATGEIEKSEKLKGPVKWAGRVGFNECVKHLEGKKGITDAKRL